MYIFQSSKVADSFCLSLMFIWFYSIIYDLWLSMILKRVWMY